LLVEAGKTGMAPTFVSVDAKGAEAAADTDNVKSPETYVGYERAENFASPGGLIQDTPSAYVAAPSLSLNQWGLSGKWTVGGEKAVLEKSGGSIAYRFHARDLHLVLGPGANGAPVRFKVTIDGKPPGGRPRCRR
jgi:hypothetical protein